MLVSNMTLAEKTNLTAGTGIFMGRCVGRYKLYYTLLQDT